jgi:hypothetical protein
MKHQDATEEIISFLNRKKGYYEKILRLTQTQEEVIKSNNIKDLDSIIKEKEGFVEDIKRLDRLNERTQNEIFTERNSRDIRIDSLLGQLQSLITNIMDYDRKGINRLYSLINNTKTTFDNLYKMQRSQISMGMEKINTSSFVDVFR